MTDGLTVRCSTNWATEELLVGAQGFEPWTCRLKAECSTAELYSQMIARHEEGLEPLIQLKKTAVFKSFLQSKLKSGWGAGNRTQSSRIWVEITIHCRFTKNKKCRRCFSVLPLHYTSIVVGYWISTHQQSYVSNYQGSTRLAADQSHNTLLLVSANWYWSRLEESNLCFRLEMDNQF